MNDKIGDTPEVLELRRRVHSVLTQRLKSDVYMITFYKKDGSRRSMVSTHICNMNRFPAPTLPESEKPKTKRQSPNREFKYNDNIIKVWDVENRAIKSICLDSIIAIKSLNFQQFPLFIGLL